MIFFPPRRFSFPMPWAFQLGMPALTSVSFLSLATPPPSSSWLNLAVAQCMRLTFGEPFLESTMI